MATELDDAISKAAEEIAGGEKTEEKPEVTLDAEEAEETGETSEEEEELSEDEKGESLRLYKALKDPKTAGPIIAALAQQAGLFNGKQPETRAEERRDVKAVKDILGEALGQYKFLADALAPAIEKILEQERSDHEEKFAEIQRSRIEQEVVASYEKIAKETKGASRQLEAQMAKLSEEIPIGTMSVETYLRRLHTIAAGEKIKSSPKVVADRIRRNANDATSRLHTTRGEETPAAPKGKMNISQSVNWALDQIAAGRTKE